jgi:hypothetical protein
MILVTVQPEHVGYGARQCDIGNDEDNYYRTIERGSKRLICAPYG